MTYLKNKIRRGEEKENGRHEGYTVAFVGRDVIYLAGVTGGVQKEKKKMVVVALSAPTTMAEGTIPYNSLGIAPRPAVRNGSRNLRNVAAA